MRRVVTGAGGVGSEVEAEGAQLLAAVLGDLVGAPRRHPHPVDPVGRDETLEGLSRLVLDDVGERARGRRQRHVDDGVLLRVDGDAVDEAEVDDVDPELGVDDIAHRLFDVGDVGSGCGRLTHDLSLLVAVSVLVLVSLLLVSWPAWCNASVKAIHPSRAHFTRAGYLLTPAKATPSPMTSSSPMSAPFEVSMARIASCVVIASA